MAVYVNTNYSALQGQRYLGNVQNSLTTTYQRLSSGMRINSAKDDAAGLQIADRLTSQINGLNQGNRNAADGIALAQTIEAGMDEISGMLQKMRTLTVQAANGTNTAQDRAALSKEVASLATEVNRIATQTTFAGKKVLNGKGTDSIFGAAGGAGPGGAGNNGTAGKAGDKGTMTLQVGSNKGDVISFDVESVMFSQLTGNIADLIGNGKVFSTNQNTRQISVTFTKATTGTGKDSFGAIIELFDTAISKVDGMRAGLGAIQNRLESSIQTRLMLQLMKLMHAHVFVMLTLLKSLLTCHSSPSSSRLQLPC